ncbi:MAG: T9SS type A sorting domain-containing protein [Flavobacteriales bacterium]|nr:T9SS type A sorting domain-containing protein [Flavobacteriales bacterium]
MRLLLIVLLIIHSGSALAQRATLPAGHDATGAGGTISYSMGQVDYRFTSNGNGSVVQGVQQPYEWLVLAVNEPLGGGFTAALQPNPANDQVTIAIAGTTTLPLSYELRDAQGRLLREGPITSTSISVSLNGLPSAIYLVHVLEDARPLTTFQLIKH